MAKQEQLLSPEEYADIVNEQRRILRSIQDQNDGANPGLPKEQVARREHLLNTTSSRSSSRPRSSHQNNTNVYQPPRPLRGIRRRVAFFSESGVLCQCCFEDSSSYLVCSNKATPHHLCTNCVTRYVREWLHGGSSTGAAIQSANRRNYKSGRIPCFCTFSALSGEGDALCPFHLNVEDWNTLLTPPEVTQVKEKLRSGGVGGGTGGVSGREGQGRGRTIGSRWFPKLHNKSVSPKPKTSSQKNASSPNGTFSMITYSESLRPKMPSPTEVSSSTVEHGTLKRKESFGMTKRKESLQRAERKIEEIKTCARLRTCPTCDKSFVKENGCNRMTCPSCFTNMCYCCRLIVPQLGYDHFYVKGYNNANTDKKKCPLWTDETTDSQMEQKWIKDRLFRMAQQIMDYPNVSTADSYDQKMKAS